MKFTVGDRVVLLHDAFVSVNIYEEGTVVQTGMNDSNYVDMYLVRFYDDTLIWACETSIDILCYEDLRDRINDRMT